MAERKKNNTNQLSQRMVRNNDIFCSLLINQTNKSIRVIDFRGGNFQLKHNYLERILLADGMSRQRPPDLHLVGEEPKRLSNGTSDNDGFSDGFDLFIHCLFLSVIGQQPS